MSEKREKAKEELEDMVIRSLVSVGLEVGKLYSIDELQDFSMKYNDTEDPYHSDVCLDMSVLLNETKRVKQFVKIEPKREG